MTDLFFKVYPEEVKRFNRKAPHKVTFVISDEYKGVAATVGTIVKYNPLWLAQNPEDIDCATHELMHVVQAYHSDNNPGWLVEGIADYCRNAFGVNKVMVLLHIIKHLDPEHKMEMEENIMQLDFIPRFMELTE